MVHGLITPFTQLLLTETAQFTRHTHMPKEVSHFCTVLIKQSGPTLTMSFLIESYLQPLNGSEASSDSKHERSYERGEENILIFYHFYFTGYFIIHCPIIHFPRHNVLQAF